MTEQADRIRAAVEKNPRKMTLQLARDLGVPEVEVIRAYPPKGVMERDALRSFYRRLSIVVMPSSHCLARASFER